jgi:hypothetical protein
MTADPGLDPTRCSLTCSSTSSLDPVSCTTKTFIEKLTDAEADPELSLRNPWSQPFPKPLRPRLDRRSQIRRSRAKSVPGPAQEGSEPQSRPQNATSQG